MSVLKKLFKSPRNQIFADIKERKATGVVMANDFDAVGTQQIVEKKGLLWLPGSILMENNLQGGSLMLKARSYGIEPYKAILVHGGPGAAGELAPVAKELSSRIGIVEALQSKRTISEMTLELKTVVKEYSEEPVQLVGYSWGAWLSFIFAAVYPEMVRKLILVSSGPFDVANASRIRETRLSRLNEEDKKLLESLEMRLNRSDPNKERILLQYGNLMSKADAFDPLVLEPNDEMNVDLEIFQNVWKEASELRSSGELLKLGKKISCPVVVIHGDYDSHPFDGVVQTLKPIISAPFKYFILENCGHKPWNERLAKDRFFDLLYTELTGL
jgi:pimeloyl-ACP methyl ester carboxylesterase